MNKLIVLTLLVFSMVLIAPPADAAVRIGVGLGYGRPAFRPRSVWFGPAYWGPPIYYAAPAGPSNSGELKVDTNARDAGVYINGAFAGTVGKLKTLRLRSGTYDIEIRNSGGGVFDQKVFVPMDKKVVVEPVFTTASK